MLFLISFNSTHSAPVSTQNKPLAPSLIDAPCQRETKKELEETKVNVEIPPCQACLSRSGRCALRMRAHEVYLANIYISSLDQHLCFVISCTGKMRPCLGRGQICLRSSHPKEAIEASSTQPHLEVVRRHSRLGGCWWPKILAFENPWNSPGLSETSGI